MSFFYTAIERIGNKIHFRGYRNGRQFDEALWYKPRLYIPSQNPQSKYKSIHGEPLEPIDFDSMGDAWKFVKDYGGVEGFSYHGQENPIYSFISDYFDKPIDYDEKLIRLGWLDIEVETENGFPDVKLANRKITSITFHVNGVYHAFGYKEYLPAHKGIIYHKCVDEEELLRKFVTIWEDSKLDVVLAWAGEKFDIPYIINRIRVCLGEAWVLRLSPWRKVQERTIRDMFGESQTYLIFGVVVLDYMELYKKLCEVPRENYRLNTIAHLEIGENKINYSEHETLNKLYNENHQKYIEYNIHDVGLMIRIEAKTKYLSLAFGMGFTAKIVFPDVFKHTRLWDGIIYNYLKPKNIIIPKKPEYTTDKKAYEGGHVKEPIPDMYSWPVSLDATSLYPHLFMQYNISPETFVGHVPVNFEDLVVGAPHGHDKYLDDNDLSLSGSGAVFKRTTQGFLPKLLSEMFNKRKAAKNKMLELDKIYQQNKNNLSKDEQEAAETEIQKWNIMQLSLKKQLVACYGAFGQSAFRYFKVDIAEAITTSGRLSFRWVEYRINKFLSEQIGVTKDYVIYGDTDSVWVNFGDLVAKHVPSTLSRNKTADFLDGYINKKIQPFLNSILHDMCVYTHGIGDKVGFKREKIADKAVFMKKKRYFVNVLDEENVRYTTPKMKVTGMKSKATNVSDTCRKAFDKLYWIMCNEGEEKSRQFIEDYKKEFLSLSPEEIAVPQGVNSLDDYINHETVYEKGTPAHIRGSLVFNHWLKEKKITDKFDRIVTGEKIKYLYLKEPNPINENVIAVVTQLPMEFDLHQYVDYEKQFEKSFMKPTSDLFDVVKWSVEPQDKVEDFFE